MALNERIPYTHNILKLLHLIQALSFPTGRQQCELPWQDPYLVHLLCNRAMEVQVTFHLWMPSTY